MTHPAPGWSRPSGSQPAGNEATDTQATDARPRRARPARLRWSQLRAQWPLALVVVGLAVALGFVMFERWRRGAFLLGLVALAAAVLRGVVPEHRARLLGVRGKGFDVAFYSAIGVVVLWLSISIDALGTG
ncbi:MULTISPECIES: DUF3017 domain-containing protein [Dietzia]|uniref:DUF3017 domain-containing protein n=1 Tax=Dietzia maris TaxID=37915 RepID=A0A365PC45_9ACTN|nr:MULTISPECIES: DUF3017 domain-containing protein [Dietzia]MCY1656167.1 DUF3017 domain-containing protein [Dietzia sp. SL131]RBA37661.1 DUF3017 domain-containing protein [Dietzia maris]